MGQKEEILPHVRGDPETQGACRCQKFDRSVDGEAAKKPKKSIVISKREKKGEKNEIPSGSQARHPFPS
ncbi:MAG: hypothetical protein A2156_01455 [Deltaproteobacteria bacterium RBG_16_48_10]|nr:MAG: hypothetical protein A2156_01455 [Deltaproteobacteria bacterium RBG_16_48_10]